MSPEILQHIATGDQDWQQAIRRYEALIAGGWLSWDAEGRCTYDGCEHLGDVWLKHTAKHVRFL